MKIIKNEIFRKNTIPIIPRVGSGEPSTQSSGKVAEYSSNWSADFINNSNAFVVLLGVINDPSAIYTFLFPTFYSK